jgi:hypothetical protein
MIFFVTGMPFLPPGKAMQMPVLVGNFLANRKLQLEQSAEIQQ